MIIKPTKAKVIDTGGVYAGGGVASGLTAKDVQQVCGNNDATAYLAFSAEI